MVFLFPKFRFSDQRKTTQWQQALGLTKKSLKSHDLSDFSIWGVFSGVNGSSIESERPLPTSKVYDDALAGGQDFSYLILGERTISTNPHCYSGHPEQH